MQSPRMHSWCGSPRRTVDLARLSTAGRHESHHTRSAAEIAKSVPAGKLNSTLDCVDGYHGAELAKEDRHKTNFTTEWDMFPYLRVRLTRGMWSDQQGGELSLLARDFTRHYQNQRELLDLRERCSFTAGWSPSGSTASLLPIPICGG
jgi:hypothetical protein